MNWHKKILLKTAAARSKIQRYNIANPSVKFFIHRYENSIPWNDIEQIKKNGGNVEEYIQNYISSNLLPPLKEKTNPESGDNNFMKPDSISDENVAQELRQTDEAQGRTPRESYSDSLIQQARGQILNDVNNEKAEQFNRWLEYMDGEETYASNPAFQYSILKPIIDSSPHNKKCGSPPLNAEILAGIWEEINEKGVDQMNVLKKYKKLVIKAEEQRAKASGVQETDKGGTWIRIEGGDNAESKEELKDNIDRLKNLSQGTGWCTGRGMANTYLPQGDFYLYLEGGKAVVAIRCVGNKVVEIRGYNNKQEHLDPYWQEVMSFLSTTNLDYKDNLHYKALQDIALMNASLEKGTSEYNMVLEQIKSDHKVYLKLSDENKQRFPEFLQIASDGYKNELEKILKEIESPLIKEDEYSFKFDKFQDQYKEIPQEIRDNIGDMKGRILEVHKKAYYNNPIIFADFPTNIQAQFSKADQMSAWKHYVGEDPYRFNDNRIPEDIKPYFSMDVLKEEYKKLIQKNPDHIDYIKPEILNMFKPGEIEGYILQDFANYPMAMAYGKLIKLERMENLAAQGKIQQQQIIDILAQAIRTNPKWMSVLPKKYQEEINKSQGVGIQNIVENEKIKNILRDIGYFKSLSLEEQNSLLQKFGVEIGEAFAKELNRSYKGLYHQFWINVPKNVRTYLPFEIIDATAQYYADQINKNPSNQDAIIKQISPDIQPFVFTKLSSRKNWYKSIKISHYSEPEQKGEGRGGGGVGQFGERRLEDWSGEHREEISIMKNIIKRQDWANLEIYKEKLLNHYEAPQNQQIVNSIISSAMAGQKL